jgi:DNA topoisomerase III
VVKENYRRFACTGCDWSISKAPSSRMFAASEVEELIRDKAIGPLQGFRSKLGRPFAAILKLAEPDWKMEFDFGQSEADAANEAPVDFSGQERVGPCPKCGAGVYEHGMSYVCEKSVGPERSCDFRSGKVILQQPVERGQMQKLLAEGRTDLLDAFVSSRTRRRFKAFLVRQPDGKVGFEFQPSARAVKAAAGGVGAAGVAAGGSTGEGAGEGAPNLATGKAPVKAIRGRATVKAAVGGAAGKAAGKASGAKAAGTKAAGTKASGTKAKGAARTGTRAATPRRTGAGS